MNYSHQEIEKKWQEFWANKETFKAEDNSEKPKFYALDMFPYPSGAGLHVGHPLGYIASDVYSRYKRHQGYNVLHPMGYDSFGLPAEQYAIQTGQHPAITTEENIARYRQQLDKIGFSVDWSREVRTSNPNYYKWTQWIFIQLFDAWYNTDSNKAEPISTLITQFETKGSAVNAHHDSEIDFSAEEWNAYSEKEQQTILLDYRLAYLGEAMVNWCPQLGTVLANDEVKDGVSERGGYPVVQKKMKQWSLRITAYAERLLTDLESLDWSESLKEQQRNWIGKSFGASLNFNLAKQLEESSIASKIEVFTTRPDTIFGVTFMVLSPEHELVSKITTSEQEQEVEGYVLEASKRSERDRMSDTKTVSGAFTGAYAVNPFTNKEIPIYIADYVLMGYGTGAIMAVPGGDERDYKFAQKFEIEIIPVCENTNLEEGPNASKDEIVINSDFLNGLTGHQAIKKSIEEIEKKGVGYGKVNYRLRNAVFGRQRYWGEPIPIYYKDGIPHALDPKELPLELPEVDKYLPTEDGEPPLARAENWKYQDKYDYEHSTMPGWAGSSWYYLRYLDANNDSAFVDPSKLDYWGNIDLYIGGAEHATGHLLYVRFWTKVLHDLGYIKIIEPAQKLINQGMISGVIEYMYLSKEKKDGNHHFICSGLVKNRGLKDVARIPVPVKYVRDYGAKDSYLDQESIGHFVEWFPEYKSAIFECANGEFHNGEFKAIGNETNSKLITHSEVGKMSKRYHNTVDPEDICNEYGADTLRLYEMFLGPLEEHKPWNTQGIEGTHRFIKKLWRLVFDENSNFKLNDEAPTKESLKTIHNTIKRITEDLERYSFNTPVSNYMIAVNELTSQKCTSKAVLSDLLVLLSPYAPHVAEELWNALGNENSISTAQWPKFDPSVLVESAVTYPVSFNGKMRFKIELPTSMSKEDIEKEVLAAEQSQKWLKGKTPKKVIVVPKKIVNVVV